MVEILYHVFKQGLTGSDRSYISHSYFQEIYLIIILCMVSIFVFNAVDKVVVKLIEESKSLKEMLFKKDLYQAAIIHELRNPLNSVIGGIDLLTNSKCLSLEDKKHLQIV